MNATHFPLARFFASIYFFLSKGKEVAFVVAFAPASAPQSPVTPTAVHHAGACHWRPTSASACRWNLVTVFLPIYFINRFPAVVCLGSTCSTGGGRRGVKCTKSKTKQTSRPKANKRARSLSLSLSCLVWLSPDNSLDAYTFLQLYRRFLRGFVYAKAGTHAIRCGFGCASCRTGQVA